jgi:hypothetical protein
LYGTVRYGKPENRQLKLDNREHCPCIGKCNLEGPPDIFVSRGNKELRGKWDLAGE